eukprot:6854467-Prymnesium_polylepis.1
MPSPPAAAPSVRRGMAAQPPDPYLLRYIRGYACESNLDGVSLAITSEADLDALVLHEEEKDTGVGGLRLAEELTVFALGANHENEYQISL